MLSRPVSDVITASPYRCMMLHASLNHGLQALAFTHAGRGLCSHHHWRELPRHRGKTCLDHLRCGDWKLERHRQRSSEDFRRCAKVTTQSRLTSRASRILALCSRQSGCPMPEPRCLLFLVLDTTWPGSAPRNQETQSECLRLQQWDGGPSALSRASRRLQRDEDTASIGFPCTHARMISANCGRLM